MIRRKKILCGGEALTIDLANKLQALCGEVWNMYGPNETNVWSSVFLISPVNPMLLVGRPIDNTQFYILDKQDQ